MHPALELLRAALNDRRRQRNLLQRARRAERRNPTRDRVLATDAAACAYVLACETARRYRFQLEDVTLPRRAARLEALASVGA